MKKVLKPPPEIVLKKSIHTPHETKGDENKPEPQARGKLARWWHIIILATLVIIFFSTAVWNIVALSLAAFGILNPVLAVVLAEAGCISVVINSALLLLSKPKAFAKIKGQAK